MKPDKIVMEHMLRNILDVPSVVTFTDNRRSMISVRRRDQEYHVRLHHLFRGADEGVLKALAEYISGNSRRSLRVIRDFIGEHRHKIRQKASAASRRARITHQGLYFNLLDSFTELNDRYFGGGIECSITWGKRIRHSRRRSIRLGSYSPSSKIIRINPILDREFVPQYVVESITYHEMLHSFLGFRYVEGRRFSHYLEFKEMERRFIHNDIAKLWIKKNLNLLTQKS
jgi:hypothetical protein